MEEFSLLIHTPVFSLHEKKSHRASFLFFLLSVGFHLGPSIRLCQLEGTVGGMRRALVFIWREPGLSHVHESQEVILWKSKSGFLWSIQTVLEVLSKLREMWQIDQHPFTENVIRWKNQPLEPYSQYTELKALRATRKYRTSSVSSVGITFLIFRKIRLPYFSSTFYFRKYPKSQSQSFIKNEPMLVKVIWKKNIYKCNMNEQLSWIFLICKRTLMLCYGTPSYINLKMQRISKWDAWSSCWK